MKARTGRSTGFQRGEAILAAAVLIHFAITVAHGFAHARARVAISPASMVFGFAVILSGPILGLIIQRAGLPREGAGAIAAMMTAALAFGIVNHFLITGTDHVSHMAQPWRVLFGVTAALLVPTEACGAAAAVWCAVSAS
jgi:hypothetical protein